MYSNSSYEQQLFYAGRRNNLPTNCNPSTYNYFDDIKPIVNANEHTNTNLFQYPSPTTKNEQNGDSPIIDQRMSLNVSPISNLFDQLLNLTSEKSLPDLVGVQMSKERLKRHPKATLLFTVLSELKEGNCNLNGLVTDYTQENIRKLRGIKYDHLTKSQDATQSENQLIRLDNMLAAEGIIHSKRNPNVELNTPIMQFSNEDNTNDGPEEYRNKLLQIQEIYNQEENKVNEELNIFPKHVLNILRQQSEIRPIKQFEIELMQKVVNQRYSILHIHLKQKTCEAIMVLRTKCLDARRKRRNFSKKSSEILNEFFLANVTHPYPSEEAKQELAKKCGITVSQVCNWFGNKRIRYKKSIAKNEDNAKCFKTETRENETTHTSSEPINWSESNYFGTQSSLAYSLFNSNNASQYYAQM